MASLGTTWLFSILLLHQPSCIAAAGPPAQPSDLQCYIPVNEDDIHCTWDPGPDQQIHSNYSLHWKPANVKEGLTKATNVSGSIARHTFTQNSELHVWVQAENQYGSSTSHTVTFNPANIIKPSPPRVTVTQDPLEFLWNYSSCVDLDLSLGNCMIRHRTEEDQVWIEDEAGIFISHTIDNPRPYTVYEFQVCCACEPGVMSDWSEIATVRSAGTAPTGEVDVWMDCGMPSTNADCVLTWKMLPVSQSRGHILGYEVRLLYRNGSTAVMNMSAAEPRGQLVCDDMQCHLTSSLKDVSSATVSAYSVHGATLPARVDVPATGKQSNGQAIVLKMNEENLNVSWNPPSEPSDNLKEYVVQYKQVGQPPPQGFDWDRVKKGQTRKVLKGRFAKYTPYLVSLFTISHNFKAQQLSSAIGYSLEGIPSKVSSFKVNSIDATRVTLFWEPIPLLKQNGTIISYQIGGVDQTVHTVTASLQNENQTFDLLDLSPGWDYEVWIRAVTAAGPGSQTTTHFKTKDQESFAPSAYLMIASFAMIGLCTAVFLLRRKNCLPVPLCFDEKVPDPRNSNVLRQMKHQINDSLSRICIPAHESLPKISELEVVEHLPSAFEPNVEKNSHPNGLGEKELGSACSQTGRGYGCEEYSKMMDSDEERSKEDEEEEEMEESLCSSEEEQFTSGYEKHFMPTALEVQQV
ncbi:interleukin 12 receptor, beta 2a, like isoform X2 [Thalassophryne amazonica]|uniref:interleukin 12 receptor, beta 2a, like isoform X2 n=1 Tax=Thalassophryne amazonica TaxID=390379 RepID=UPI001471591C|nr:interleukin 12 receptor, beta 2a, like isoform X2 [Thalassophryne amazonica]